MKKQVIILLIITCFIPFFTNKNDYVDVTSVISVSSIGIDFDKEKKEYSFYFYVLNNFNLAQAELSSSNVDTLAYITKISDQNFINAFEKFRKISNVFVHYNHLRTVILTNHFLEDQENINQFYYFIKNNPDFYPTFYLFSTDCKIEEIYQIKTFSDISANYTLLINPTSIKTYQLTTFIEFIRAMDLTNYTVKIPHLSSASETTNKQDEPFKSVILNGYSVYVKDRKYFDILEDDIPTLHWLEELNDKHFVLDKYALYIKNGKYKVKKKNGKIVITYILTTTITSAFNTLVNTKEIEHLNTIIKQELISLYNFGVENNLDLFNLKYLTNDLETDLQQFNTEFIVKIDIG